MRLLRASAVWFLLAALGVPASCSSSSGPSAPTPDASEDAPGLPDVAEVADPQDGAPDDMVAADAAGDPGATGIVEADAVATDATDTAAAGKSTAWGSVVGSCGQLAAEVASPTPAFLVNTYTFSTSGPIDPTPLRPGAKKRWDGPNAGGSSKCSEVMSMQLLADCEGAITYKTEVEILYDVQGAITDWIALVGADKVGVSVTRAYKGPTVTTYTEADATALLSKKLGGILESSANVSAADKWVKQVLHVWTLRADWVPVLRAAWDKLDAALRADTVVYVTIEQGSAAVVTDSCGAP